MVWVRLLHNQEELGTRTLSQKHSSIATASEFSGQQIRCKELGYIEAKICEGLSRILVSGSTVTRLPVVLVVYLLACARLLLHFQIQKHRYYITVVINYLPIKIITNVRQDLAFVAMALFFFANMYFFPFCRFLLYFFKQSHKYLIRFHETECLSAFFNLLANNGHYKVKWFSSNDILNWTRVFQLLLC